MEQLQIHLAWGSPGRQNAAERRMTHRIARSLRTLGRGTRSVNVHDVAPAIQRGHDPLGEHFVTSVSPEERRDQGATFTPSWIVELQLARIAAKYPQPIRIIDAGAG